MNKVKIKDNYGFLIEGKHTNAYRSALLHEKCVNGSKNRNWSSFHLAYHSNRKQDKDLAATVEKLSTLVIPNDYFLQLLDEFEESYDNQKHSACAYESSCDLTNLVWKGIPANFRSNMYMKMSGD